jgi:SAM-dependent methyltransferase
VVSYFTGKTDDYDRFRPDYPDAATRLVLDGLPVAPLVADIGSGTGISSRAFARAGARVIGIEPNDDMRRRAALAAAPPHGSIEWRAGSADVTGLAPASVDLVVCAQSYHWFDPMVVLPEFRRILKRPGRLALLWNIREPRDAFSVEYEGIIDEARVAAERGGRWCPRERSADPAVGGWFGGVRRAMFPNPQRRTLNDLLGRARSTSAFPVSGAMRDELEARIATLFAHHAKNGYVTLHQRCEVTLATPVHA